jgi:hypothetical protein
MSMTSSEHTKSKKKLILTLPPAKQKISAVGEEDEEVDLDYVPPKRPRPEPKSPANIFNSQGEEEMEHTKLGERLVRELQTVLDHHYPDFV